MASLEGRCLCEELPLFKSELGTKLSEFRHPEQKDFLHMPSIFNLLVHRDTQPVVVRLQVLARQRQRTIPQKVGLGGLAF